MARTSARNAPETHGEQLPAVAEAMVFRGTRLPLRLESIPLTAPACCEMLVRITACTICGSDLHTVQGHRNTPTPTILGHEIIGEIAAVHPQSEYRDINGQRLAIGDRVTWSIAASCGTCFFCQHGLPQKCDSLFKYGHEPLSKSPQLSGGFAQYCHLAQGSHVLRLPPGLPDAVACPANCATATVAAALRTAGACKDQDVLVQGGGLLGLTACAMAKSMGARRVVLLEPDESRLAWGKAFGANLCLTPQNESCHDVLMPQANEGRGFDLILEMSGAHAALRQGLQFLRIGGRYVWVGTVSTLPPLELNPEMITRRLLTITGVHNYTPQDLASAVAFLTDNHAIYPFQDLVSNWFHLNDFQQALDFAIEKCPVRVGIRP